MILEEPKQTHTHASMRVHTHEKTYDIRCGKNGIITWDDSRIMMTPGKGEKEQKIANLKCQLLSFAG